jgi:hypothetical protein
MTVKTIDFFAGPARTYIPVRYRKEYIESMDPYLYLRKHRKLKKKRGKNV